MNVSRRFVDCNIDQQKSLNISLWPHTDFSVLDGTPLEALNIHADDKERREHDDSFDSQFFALIVLRFSRPV